MIGQEVGEINSHIPPYGYDHYGGVAPILGE